MRRAFAILALVTCGFGVGAQSLNGVAYGGGEYDASITFDSGRFDFYPFLLELPENLKGSYTFSYVNKVPILRLNGEKQITMVFLHNDYFAQFTFCNYFGESSVMVTTKTQQIVKYDSVKEGVNFIVPDYRATATSFLSEGLREYRPENLAGSALYGPWVSGTPGGIGQKIFMDFTRNPGSGKPTSVNGLLVSNGFVSNYHPEYYEYNNRVRKIRVSSEKPVFTQLYELQDTPDFQTVKLPQTALSVTIEVVDIFQGTKFNDTAINAIYGISSMR